VLGFRFLGRDRFVVQAASTPRRMPAIVGILLKERAGDWPSRILELTLEPGGGSSSSASPLLGRPPEVPLADKRPARVVEGTRAFEPHVLVVPRAFLGADRVTGRDQHEPRSVGGSCITFACGQEAGPCRLPGARS